MLVMKNIGHTTYPYEKNFTVGEIDKTRVCVQPDHTTGARSKNKRSVPAIYYPMRQFSIGVFLCGIQKKESRRWNSRPIKLRHGFILATPKTAKMTFGSVGTKNTNAPSFGGNDIMISNPTM